MMMAKHLLEALVSAPTDIPKWQQPLGNCSTALDRLLWTRGCATEDLGVASEWPGAKTCLYV